MTTPPLAISVYLSNADLVALVSARILNQRRDMAEGMYEIEIVKEPGGIMFTVVRPAVTG